VPDIFGYTPKAKVADPGMYVFDAETKAANFDKTVNKYFSKMLKREALTTTIK
jgi:hypothetical protein